MLLEWLLEDRTEHSAPIECCTEGCSHADSQLHNPVSVEMCSAAGPIVTEINTAKILKAYFNFHEY